MSMDDDETKVPRPILDRLAALLRQDGFKPAFPGLYVRNLDLEWRAWIGVSGFPYMLFPKVGVYNQKLKDIVNAAWLKIGFPSQQPPDSGPPLIMTDIERLIGNDPDCKARESWDIDLDALDLQNLQEYPELMPSVADDLVYCLRKKAYPFFADHMTFQSIWDAACQRMGSPALANYFPLLLIKLGRRNDVMKYVEERLRNVQDQKYVKDYRAYVEELLKLMPD